MTKGREEKIWKVASVLLLMFMSARAQAVPTVCESHPVSLCSNSPVSIDSSLSQSGPIVGSVEKFRAELFAPPSVGSLLGDTEQSTQLRVLPAAPAAFLMLFVGFLCVSIVRDRKVWLTTVTGLICIGYAFFSAIPNTAAKLGHTTVAINLSYPKSLLSVFVKTDSFRLTYTKETLVQVCEYTVVNQRFFLPSFLEFKAVTAEQLIRFNPAFVFQVIPRGPPVS